MERFLVSFYLSLHWSNNIISHNKIPGVQSTLFSSSLALVRRIQLSSPDPKVLALPILSHVIYNPAVPGQSRVSERNTSHR